MYGMLPCQNARNGNENNSLDLLWQSDNNCIFKGGGGE